MVASSFSAGAVALLLTVLGIYLSASTHSEEDQLSPSFRGRRKLDIPFLTSDPKSISSRAEYPLIQTPALHIRFYGGSITVGRDFPDHTSRRYSTLVGERLGALAVNRAIPAAGPGQHLICGIRHADIIVSEYRINEKNMAVLDKWYDLACQNARHVIILDLWSWLSPPQQKKSATVRAVERRKKSMCPNGSTTFSILSLDKQDQNIWQCLVPFLFNYTVPNALTGAYIPTECYDTLHSEGCERDEVVKYLAAGTGGGESDIIQQGGRRLHDACTSRTYARAKQHGQPPYHEYVANRLVSHIKGVVLPILERSPELKYAMPSSSACFGEWGNGNTRGGWEGVILENNGFAISSPFSGRVDKTTLNSNAEGSSVVLGCPPEYPFVRIAWVEHSWGNETVTASLASVSDAGGKAQKAVGINTFSPPQTSLPFRLLKFSGVHTPPVVVTLLKKRAPGAFLEIASVACSE